MHLLVILSAMIAPAPATAQRAEAVRCSLDEAPARPCRMTVTTRAGVRTLRFRIGDRAVTFVGRSQGGWWSGRLDGKPAMGFERNRGHVVFSTGDLSRTLAWFYPASEHGTY